MAKWLLAVFLAASLAAPRTSTAADVDVPTTWEGRYHYRDGRASVPFQLKLEMQGARFTGRIEEPATFGDGASRKLFANVTGSIVGTRVSFTKTYDGTGGQRHSIAYQGTIDRELKTMAGSWRISLAGRDTGTWDARSVVEVPSAKRNNQQESRSFEPALWKSRGEIYIGDEITFAAGDRIAVIAESDAVPQTMQFRYLVTARALDAQGNPVPSISTKLWLRPVDYSSRNVGLGVSQQTVIKSNEPSRNVRWTVKIPPQQPSHDNFNWAMLRVYSQ